MAPLANEKTYKLNNGVIMPAVGFGTFANEGSKGETYKAVTKALETGYRHLDCAWFYQNEEEVGDAIKDFLASNTSVTRKDLFTSTSPSKCNGPSTARSRSCSLTT
jgi:diketogulonate reductase-like aldo/keto reductase